MRAPPLILGSLALIAGALALAESGRGLAQSASAPTGAAKPVLVELYQSQGCSSCPPAEANLNALADRPDVVALSFGVTYWDYLGWRDSFAKPQFTERQWDYAHYNRQANVATPQVWINGRRTIVGNDRAELTAAIAAAPGAGPVLAVRDGKLGVGAGRAPAHGADIWLAAYDPRTIQVAIRAGENGGRTLPHRNIVRQLVRIGHWDGPSTSVALPPLPPGLRGAAFLQAGRGGPVLAVTRLS
ncbi:DUF1223 domain-containing protein [Sphingomonas mali]|uniref:DUF1223 domain-containing protein n=1 Tax=Sphingomonas mali TaxID=40682 RepID=UPI0008336547|nr:DUF1223 domain-containing protein [Sphingomonas mali]